MSLVTPAEVTVLVETSLETAELQAVIDREEAALAAIIGPLAGDRTEVFLLTVDMAAERLTLRRPTDEVEVTDNGVAVAAADIRLLANQRTIMRFASTGYTRGYWTGPVEVTYEPNDSAQVSRGVIELVSIGLSSPATNTGLASETTGTYSYTRERTGGTASALTAEQKRRAVIATLLPKQLPTSVRVRGSVIGQRALLGTVRP